MKAWEREDASFAALLEGDPEVTRFLQPGQIVALMDPNEQLVHVNTIFSRSACPHESDITDGRVPAAAMSHE
jgi:hypothetical protein